MSLAFKVEHYPDALKPTKRFVLEHKRTILIIKNYSLLYFATWLPTKRKQWIKRNNDFRASNAILLLPLISVWVNITTMIYNSQYIVEVTTVDKNNSIHLYIFNFICSCFCVKIILPLIYHVKWMYIV